jgi:hypothetical protein
MSTTEVRLAAMVTGWIMTLYGVRQRSWPGTILAFAGITLADGALILPEGRTAAPDVSAMRAVNT